MVSLKFYSSFKAIVCNVYNYPTNIKMNQQCQNYLCFILWIYYCNCHPIIKNNIKKNVFISSEDRKALFSQLLLDWEGGVGGWEGSPYGVEHCLTSLQLNCQPILQASEGWTWLRRSTSMLTHQTVSRRLQVLTMWASPQSGSCHDSVFLHRG